jgi:hypothetical protein
MMRIDPAFAQMHRVLKNKVAATGQGYPINVDKFHDAQQRALED